MSTDLRVILDGWEYEPGKISVRKVIGSDGREKIQTRVDLGLLQFEPEDRPDGARPYGCNSLLQYLERRLQQQLDRHGTDDGFMISSEACRELRHEAHQFYQRYLSFFVLEDFAAVARDTEHNLRAIELSREYGESDYDRAALETQRGYVMMMNARARVYYQMGEKNFDSALRILDHSVRELEELTVEADDGMFAEPVDVAAELRVLYALRDEVYEKMPAGSRTLLERELEEALADEDYERAAELRDQMSELDECE